MKRERWQRLLVDLINALQIDLDLDAYPYPGGVTYSISRRLADDTILEIHDRWWRKNDDVWIGYAVHVEGGRDSVVKRSWPLTKKRREVVAAVVEACKTAGGVAA